MAERRMFAKTIVLSDAFLDMPPTARCLYFTLSMFADDDGFVNSPKGIMRQCGASDDDMRLLIAKKFVLVFDDGVLVIKHWRINNYLQKDRYVETKYAEHKSALELDENKAYRLPADEPLNTIEQNVYTDSVYTGKDSIGNKLINTNVFICETPTVSHDDIERVVNHWNTLSALGIIPISSMANSSSRYKMLTARIREYGIESIEKAIDNIRYSSFLLGKNNRGWTIKFDWFVRPNNFPKVLEGNYIDKDAKIAKQSDRISESEGDDYWQQ